jgi:branched-chain amino acid transport system permease protein
MGVLRPSGEFDNSYAYDMSTVRRSWQWLLLTIFIIGLYALPLYAKAGSISLVNRIGITIIAVQGLNLLTGYAGKISIGQAAFMTVGGYISTLLVGELGLSFFVALPAAAIGAGIAGLIFGLPSLRVKEFYLLMATLAAQMIIPWFFRHSFPDVFNGAQGLNVPVPELFGYKFNSPDRFIYITLTAMILSTVIAHNIGRSRMGRAFIAIRDNDLAAEIMGVNLYRYQLQAFLLASIYAGVAGSLMAHNLRQINPFTFGLEKSVLFLGMLVVGGLGTSLGPILGATAIEGLLEIATILGPSITRIFPEAGVSATVALKPLLFGIVLMLFLILEPRGLAHRWQLIKAAWRLRPYSH